MSIFSKEAFAQRSSDRPMDRDASAQIGEIMVQQGFLARDKVAIVLEEQQAIGGKFGNIALRLGFVTEKQVAQALSIQAGIAYQDLRDSRLDLDEARAVSAEDSRKYGILPLYRESGTLWVAISEPNSIVKRDAVKRLVKADKVIFVGVEASELQMTQSAIYPDLNFKEKVKQLAAELQQDGSGANSGRGSVPELVKAMVWDAMGNRASDIHLVASQDIFRVFYRISGELKYQFAFKPEIYTRVAAQIKQASGMEPGDKIHHDDGTWNFDAGTRMVNIRVSKMPCVPAQEGESLVLRILDKNRISLNLGVLGFYPEDVERLVQACEEPFGMILATGPTGSGKTTTLYSMLATQNPFETNILTVENPVEYQIPGVRQVQVNEHAKVTFASALRTFLRQDPDIILVGEIRDGETAEIATHAAITGHLVLSTLHTNDAVGAIPRMLEFDVDANSLRSSLSCVIAQRLVRKICPKCREASAPTPREVSAFEKADMAVPESLFRAKKGGCPSCNDGYSGGTIIYEILYVDMAIRDAIGTDAKISDLDRLTREAGMIPIYKNGLRKVAEGVTTMEELMKATKVPLS